MSWYPGATKYELQPESDSQPAIVPDQFILHSIAAPWTPGRIYEYWRDSTNLESHFGLGYNGALGQFIGTQTRADANASANRRANGHGAVSLESASNLKHTDPWTDEQIDTIVGLGVWLHEEHSIPLRVCRTWDDPGYGYHRLFPQWSTGGTACPGDARVQQFHDVVFPRIKNGEVSMALSDSDVDKVAAAVVAQLTSADGLKKLLGRDNVLASPADASDHGTNPYWAWGSHIQAATAASRAANTKAAELAKDMDEVKAALARLEARP